MADLNNFQKIVALGGVLADDEQEDDQI